MTLLPLPQAGEATRARGWTLCNHCIIPESAGPHRVLGQPDSKSGERLRVRSGLIPATRPMRRAGGYRDSSKARLHSHCHHRFRCAGAVCRPGPRCAQGRDRLCRRRRLLGNLRQRARPEAKLGRDHRRDAGSRPDHLGDGHRGRPWSERRHRDAVRAWPQPRGLSRGVRLHARPRRGARRYRASALETASRIAARDRRSCARRATKPAAWGRARPCLLPSRRSRRSATPALLS
ncbi:hypothetical protein ACVWW1_006263 [Bradyrhizobium sp. JR3.5]